ncbi:putative translation elongation factor Tu [Teladorsagia circumcincta]|nr:putative translation elongation factor Tu [Teladorsagia circumcincta]
MSGGGWNLNAASFVPNLNARPFVPGQPYVPPTENATPAPPPEAPAEVSSVFFEDWDAEIAENQDEIAEPSAPPAPEPVPEVVETPVEKPEEAGGGDEKETSEASDVVAPLAKKFERVAYVDDGTHKEHVNMVFIGHVDAGKSTIGGQLMYLTGMVDKRTLEKYEREAKEKGRESWYLSWCMDTNEEEREKGKTVECGRAYFETEKKHFTILDAPGHKSFVPNMISGATQADLAVLVISARKGEFETGFDRGGQTREHAMLVKTAGVRHLVILVNKMDDPTVKWDENRGPCFIDYVDNHLVSMARDFNGPVRCIVVDKFSDMGTLIIGKMESGVVVKGQNLVLMPNKQAVQVIQIWSDDIETDRVVSGDNVKFKLKGVEENELQSGFIICSADALCKVGRVFDAEVVILEHKSIIASGYTCVLHIQSAVEEVTVKMVICTIDKKTGEKKKSRFVRQDEKCIMRIESSEAFCLEPFKELPQLGRFTLRDEGRTIAIGKVLKVVE